MGKHRFVVTVEIEDDDTLDTITEMLDEALDGIEAETDASISFLHDVSEQDDDETDDG